MIKRLLLLLFFSPASVLFAQTIKTDVLIIGSSASGVAAAMQCARSKVKTVLAAGSIQLAGSSLPNEKLTLNADRNIPSGIWGEFRKHIRDFYKGAPGNDTAYNAPLKFERTGAETILKKMTDMVKDLTVYLNTGFTAIKKDGDRWEVNMMQDGKSIAIKARIVVDATENGLVADKAGGKFKAFTPYPDNGIATLYRTSIAAGEKWPGRQNSGPEATARNYPPHPFWLIPMDALLLSNDDNLLITERILPADKNIDYLPLQLELGQGVGAIAAYCALFKTTTTDLNVRIIQGKLLDFKGCLLPFTDCTSGDPDWRAIQQVCATGLLKGEKRTLDGMEQFDFMPDQSVSTAEIEPVLTEIYTRAFLWFRKEKPGEKFTVANTLSLISDYTLTDPLILKGSVQKAWKTQYKFKLDFDLNRPVTRREFAVLANRYLNPFSRTVDLRGRLVN